MCFSAEASFLSSALLMGIAYACTTQVTSKRQYPLVSICFLFSVMQLIEGLAWLALDYGYFPSIFIPFAGYFYLIVAFFVWPVLVSFSFLLIERNKIRKKILSGFIFINLFWVIGLFIFFIKNQQMSLDLVNHSIRYTFFSPKALPIVNAVACSLIMLPIFVSSVPGGFSCGLAVFLAWVITNLFYSYADISVWCFFGTVSTLCILRILYLLRQGYTQRD